MLQFSKEQLMDVILTSYYLDKLLTGLWIFLEFIEIYMVQLHLLLLPCYNLTLNKSLNRCLLVGLIGCVMSCHDFRNKMVPRSCFLFSNQQSAVSAPCWT